MKELSRDFPKGLSYDIVYNPTEFIAESINEVYKTILEAVLLVVIVIIVFLQSWRMAIVPIVAIPVSLIGTLAVLYAARLLAQHADAVRPRAGDRHRRRRCDRRGRERRAQYRRGHGARIRRRTDHGRSRHGGHRDLAGADRRVRADRLHSRHFRAVLPAVRDHHRGVDGDLGIQFADAFAGAGRTAVQAAPRRGGAAALFPGAVRTGAADGFNRGFDRLAHWLFEHRPRPGRLVDRDRRHAGGFRRPHLRHGLHGAGGAARLHSVARPGLCDRRRPVAGRRLAVADRRGHPAGVADHPEDAGRRLRSRLRRLLRRDLHQRQQCRRDLRRVQAVRRATESRPVGDQVIGNLFGRLQSIQEAFIIALPPPPIRGVGNAGGFKLQIQERNSADMRQILALPTKSPARPTRRRG